MESETAVVDHNGRVSFIVAVPRPDMKQDYEAHGTHCVEYDPEFVAVLFSNWKEEEDGHLYCDQARDRHGPRHRRLLPQDLPRSESHHRRLPGKYSTWNTILLTSQTFSNEHYETTVKRRYKSSRDLLFEALTSDFHKCFNNPGINGPCAWAASNFIPYGTLAKGAKGVIAFRFALETGADLAQAKLALQAALDGYSSAVINKLLATADAIRTLASPRGRSRPIVSLCRI